MNIKKRNFKVSHFIATLSFATTLPLVTFARQNDVCEIGELSLGMAKGIDSEYTPLGKHSLNMNNYKENPLYKAALDGLNRVIQNASGTTAEDAFLSNALDVSGGVLTGTRSGINQIKNIIPTITSSVSDALVELKNKGTLSNYQFSYKTGISYGLVSNVKYNGDIDDCTLKDSGEKFNLTLDHKKLESLTDEENILIQKKVQEKNAINGFDTINGLLSKSQIAALVLNLRSGSQSGLFEMDFDVVVALPQNLNVDVISKNEEEIVLNETPRVVAQKISIGNTKDSPVSFMHLKVKNLKISIWGTEKDALGLEFQYPTIEITFSNKVSVQKIGKSIAVESETSTAGSLFIQNNLNIDLAIDRIDVKFKIPDPNINGLMIPQLEWPESKLVNTVKAKQAGIGPALEIPWLDIFNFSLRPTLNNIGSSTYGLDKTNKQIVEKTQTGTLVFSFIYDYVTSLINFNEINSTVNSKIIEDKRFINRVFPSN